MALSVLPPVVAEQAGAGNLYVFSVADQKQYATPNAVTAGQYVIEIGGPVPRMVNLTIRKQAGGVETVILRDQETFIHTGGISSVVVHSTTDGTELRIAKFTDASLTPTPATPERDAGGGYLPYSPEDGAGIEFYVSRGLSYTLRDDNDGNGAIGWYFIRGNSGSFFYRPFGSRTSTTLANNPATDVAYRSLYDAGTHVLVFSYANASSGFTGIRVTAYSKSLNSWTTVTTIGSTTYSNANGLPPRLHFMFNNRLYPVVDDNGYYYDGANNWARTAVLAHPTSWNNGVFVNGYWMTSQSNSSFTTASVSYQVYDASANTWTLREHTIGNRGRGGLLLRANATQIAVLGRSGAGQSIENANADSSPLENYYTYTPSTNTWTLVTITNNNRHRYMRMFPNSGGNTTGTGFMPVNKYGTDAKHIVAFNNSSGNFSTTVGSSGVLCNFIDLNRTLTVTQLSIPNGGVGTNRETARPLRVSGKRHIFATGEINPTQNSTSSFNNQSLARPSFGSTIVRADGTLIEGFMPEYRVDAVAYSAEDNAFYMIGYVSSFQTDPTMIAHAPGTSSTAISTQVWQPQSRKVSDIDLKVEIIHKANTFLSTDMNNRVYPQYVYSSGTTFVSAVQWPLTTWYDDGKLFCVQYSSAGTYNHTVRIIPLVQTNTITTSQNSDGYFEYQGTNASGYTFNSGISTRIGLAWYPQDTNRLQVIPMRQAAFAGFFDNTRYPLFGNTRRPMFWTGSALYYISSFASQNDASTFVTPGVAPRVVIGGENATNTQSQLGMTSSFGLHGIMPNVFWANGDGKIVAETGSGFVTMRKSGSTDEVWFTPTMEYPNFAQNAQSLNTHNLSSNWGNSTGFMNTYIHETINGPRTHFKATLGGTEHYVLGCHQISQWYNGSNFTRYSSTNQNYYKVTHA